jgi:2-hydroxy-6-oxonona-2,4-dienedioate hydrolase
MTTDYKSIWTDLQGVDFEQRYVDVNGVRTRYLHAGQKGRPALLFLHGTGGHAEAYVRNLEAHAKHFDVYAIDMLGHGYTDKPDYDYTLPKYVEHVVGFMDALDLKTVSLSGESLGGWVASHVALAHPQRIDKLVLNTASGDKINYEALAKLRELSIAAVEDPSWERLKGRLEWLMHDKSLVHDDLVASRQAIYTQPVMKQAIGHILSMHTPETRTLYGVKDAQWKTITQPTLVLWTDRDPTATVAVGEALHAAIPGSKLVVMKDCGHWPQFEDAQTFNEVHIAFLRAS